MRPPKPAHLVSLVRFSAGVVECKCGWSGNGLTPEEISDTFQRHRLEATGKPRAALSMNLRAVEGERSGWS